MKSLICRWFGCNADHVAWISSNRVVVGCSRCHSLRTVARR